MSLTQRLVQFQEQVIAKNASPRKRPHYRARYFKIVALRILAEFLFITALVYIGQFFWLQNSGFLAIWPFVGVALSALYLRGNAALLGIAAGSCLSYLLLGFPLSTALWFSGLLAGFVWICRVVSLRLIGPVQPLLQRHILVAWLFVIIPFSFIYACLIVAAQSLLHLIPAYSAKDVIAAFLGILNGILCLTPLCLAFDPFTTQWLFKRPALPVWIGMGLLLLLTLPLCWLAPFPAIGYSIFLGVALVWYAKKYGLIPSAMSWLLLSTVYMSASIPGMHLFQTHSSQTNSLILLALFTAFATLSLTVAISPSKKK